MNRASAPEKPFITGFRTKLFTALMLIIVCLSALGLFVGQRKIAGNVERDLQRNFQTELTALHELEELRNTALAERCRALGEKPRIHAALEDNALDLLYLSAKDELRDLMHPEDPLATPSAREPHARFYRFLDIRGTVLPPNSKDAGELSPATEAQLNLKELPLNQQVGYVVQDPDSARKTINEVIAVPIFSTETGEVISTLVVGFKPFEVTGTSADAEMKSGIWVDGHLQLPSLPEAAQASLAGQIAKVVSKADFGRNNFTVMINGAPQLLFYKRLNPDSVFPAAYEICIYSLASTLEQLHRMRWQIGTIGTLLLFGGFVVSRFAATHLSRPVEQLAVDSEQNRARRRRAEKALASATEELERSTRYSADASHQLKNPITILRAGLEGLLAREDFRPEVYEEISTLLHQTRRLTSVIDDLLLLSQMDAGHLQVAVERVNLSQLVEEWLDDLSALPDWAEVKIDKGISANLFVAGEKRYTSLIVQNLLENAWKYNRPGGRISVVTREVDNDVALTVGNTGRPIPLSAQAHIFERFHHTSTASGHGLGLNLARELARLHGGDLALVRSENDWTEFQARFRASA